LVDQEGIPVEKPPPEDNAKAARHAHDWFEAVYGMKAFKQNWKSAEAFRKAFEQIPGKIRQGSHVQLHPTLPTDLLNEV